MEDSEIYFIENSRGSQTLVYDEFMFSLKNKRGERCYWNCVQSHCPARINTKNNKVTKIVAVHNHQRDTARVNAAAMMSDVRRQVRNTVLPVPSLFNEMLVCTRSSETEFADEDVINALPTFYAAKSSLYRQRSKTRPDINLEESWTQTTSGEQLLLADDGNSQRILVFATVGNLMNLSAADTWYMDGTFYSSPSYFYQLYTIHTVIIGFMSPMVYGLLPNKQEATYSRFLTLIQNAADNHNIPLVPTTIMMDFENAAWRSVRAVFHNVQVKGCFFHYTQCVWRKVQTLGLTVEYRENDDIKQLVRRAAVLPLVPVHSVEDVWFETLVSLIRLRSNSLKTM